MVKICDHKSVGIVVYEGNKILLIERKRPPFGYAVPAGHVDEDKNFEEAAKRELKEEVGLDATSLKLLKEEKKNNLCRREGGTWHHWKVYEARTKGQVHRSMDETKKVSWYSKEQIEKLARRTEKYMDGEISEEDWYENPGLEPIWYEWFQELGLLSS